ncbi:helix-turn-helix domain-containing protein [Shewanella sp. 202IG2-18]|uniref:helix-turn-helix domain-containing protein n=1 Tax=Parashewanella hymeniacidonis TaxID=2807618 RepID=UPI0019613832|nr:helix-turn-helix domain-containing protein [Parashewanella hymeniacidonis]
MAKKVTLSALPSSPYINDANVLGQLIKAKRTELGMKLIDCASLCGVGINTLSRIENGNSNCTLAATFAVLNGLGIQLTSKELLAVNEPSINDEWV